MARSQRPHASIDILIAQKRPRLGKPGGAVVVRVGCCGAGLDQTIGCYALLDDEVPACNVGQDVGAGASVRAGSEQSAFPCSFTKTTIWSPDEPLSMTFAMKYPGVA